MLTTATWSPDYFFSDTLFDVLGSNASAGSISGISCDVMEGQWEFTEITPTNDILDFLVYSWPPMFHGHGRKPLHVWVEYTAMDFEPREVQYTSLHSNFGLGDYDTWEYVEAEVEVIPATFHVAPAPPVACALIAAGFTMTRPRARSRLDGQRLERSPARAHPRRSR